MRIRVGFASRDGRQVDECLLSSSPWWIYDIGEEIELVEERKECGGCERGCRQCTEEILQELHDCDLLFACGCESKIASFLLAQGKRIVETSGTVEQTLRQVQRITAQNMSLDYYNRVQNLSQEYRVSAQA